MKPCTIMFETVEETKTTAKHFDCTCIYCAASTSGSYRVWYRETMFSQMVSYDFLLHGLLHEYFLYLVSAHPRKPTRRCEPEEGYLLCSKRFDHRSHFISFVIVRVKDKSHLMIVGAGKLREMLTLHTNPHCDQRQVWNAGAVS